MPRTKEQVWGAVSRGWVQRGERIWFAGPERGRNRRIWCPCRTGILHTLLCWWCHGMAWMAGGSPGINEASATSLFVTDPSVPAWAPLCLVLPCRTCWCQSRGEGLRPSSYRSWLGGQECPEGEEQQGLMAGRSHGSYGRAKAHRACSLPFPRPQLFPAAAGPGITISPSPAAFLPQSCSLAPSPCPGGCFGARGCHRGQGWPWGTRSVGAQPGTSLPTLFTRHIPGLQEVVQG